ncbi:OB-fold-containig protein [Ventosimonas gracilis]|nr:OB-fold-containig protein [Ventosimonas gracilis]
MDWLLASQTLPFALAFGLMLLILLVETVGMLLAASLGHWLDNLLPQDLGEGARGRVLGWLHLGKVPSLVLLVLFLLGFSLAGYALQLIVELVLDHYLPALLAALLVLPVGLFTTRAVGGLLVRLVPHDESSAVSEQSLLGLSGTISQGIAKNGWTAQARIRDQYGRVHYLLVEPDRADEQFDEGAQILIVSKMGAIWRCIRNPHLELL